MPDQLYRRLLSFTHDGVYRYRFADGRVLFANEGLIAILGLDCRPEDIIGKPMRDLLIYIEKEGTIRQELLQRREIHGFEYHFRTLGGEDKWVIHDSCIVRDADLGEEVVEAIVRDITERKRAEQAIAAEHERLSVTLQSIADAVIATDMQTRIVAINPVAQALTGWTAAEARGRLLREVFRLASEGGAPAREDPAADVLRSGEAMRLADRSVLLVRDGTRRAVEDSIAPVRSADGRTLGAVLVFRDISERRRTEQERERMATALEQLSEVVIITDVAGTIQYVNPSFEQVCGYSRSDALGQNPRLLKSGRHDRAFYEEMWKTISSGRVWRGRMTNRRRNGDWYETESVISPVRDDGGRIVHYVGVLRDVTRETDLQRQLLQAQKMEAVGRLAGGIAHDFNNLLMVIMNNADFVREKLPPGRGGQSDMDDLIEAAKRASMLTSQLLAFSRRQVLAQKVVPLNTIVRGMEDMLRRVIGEDITLAVRTPEDAGLVRADRGQIEQVIMNLIVNARDAMPEGGRITIETSLSRFHPETAGHVVEMPEAPSGQFACVSVSDTGCGMSEDIQAKIFDPFFTTKGVGRGTGLGLSTAHGIVRQHGGFMSVYSQSGRGSTFRFYLPRVSRSGEGRIEDEGAPLPCGSETILLVEDDETVRKTTEKMLSNLGYTVLLADCGGAAVEAVRRHGRKIDLLLTDIVMPGLDGRSVAEVLTRMIPGVKVIFASGYPIAHLEEIGMLGDEMMLLTKPYSRAQLAAKVREALDRM
jgi:two-component system NtrC family sensor kinase